MKSILTAALVIAAASSTAALAAPKGGDTETTLDSPGTYFNCVIPYPGPNGFRIGACWLAQ